MRKFIERRVYESFKADKSSVLNTHQIHSSKHWKHLKTFVILRNGWYDAKAEQKYVFIENL